MPGTHPCKAIRDTRDSLPCPHARPTLGTLPRALLYMAPCCHPRRYPSSCEHAQRDHHSHRSEAFTSSLPAQYALLHGSVTAAKHASCPLDARCLCVDPVSQGPLPVAFLPAPGPPSDQMLSIHPPSCTHGHCIVLRVSIRMRCMGHSGQVQVAGDAV